MSCDAFGTWIAGTRHNVSRALAADQVADLEAHLNQADQAMMQNKNRSLQPQERLALTACYFYPKLDARELHDSNIAHNGMSPLKAALIDAHVYLAHGNPEAWLAHLAELALLDIHGFHDGQEIPAQRTFFGPLPGLRADPRRGARVQLATIIKSMIDETSGSDKDELKDAVRWLQVTRLAGMREDLTGLLDALVTQLVSQMDGSSDEPFDRIDAMDPLARMELGRQLLSVLPTTADGREYLIKVMNADPEASSDEERRLARSPAHPDQVSSALKAFEFDEDWNVQPVTGAGFWGPLEDDEEAVGELVTGAAAAGKTALKIYGTYSSAAVAAFQLSQVGDDAIGAGVAGRLKSLFNTEIDWPKPEDEPPGATSKSVAVVGGLVAAVDLFNQLDSIASSSDVTANDMFALAQSVNGVVDKAAGISAAFAAGAGHEASAKLVRRMSVYVTVSLSVVDVALHLKSALEGDRWEEWLGHTGAAVAAGVSVWSVFLGSLRTVPHPAAVVVGLIGMALSAGVGWWFANLALADKVRLLRHTHFGKDSLARRVAWMRSVAADTGDGDGFEDLRYAMLTDAGEEDLARQIAILLGSMGAFGIDWSKAYMIGAEWAELQTTRKLPGYTQNSVLHNSDLDKTLLPAGSTLDIYDATHGRGGNATTLSDSVDSRLPLLLTRPNSTITQPLFQAAEDALRQESEVDNIDIGGLHRPERVEGVLTTPAPAWRATISDRAAGRSVPNATIIVRDKL